MGARIDFQILSLEPCVQVPLPQRQRSKWSRGASRSLSRDFTNDGPVGTNDIQATRYGLVQLTWTTIIPYPTSLKLNWRQPASEWTLLQTFLFWYETCWPQELFPKAWKKRNLPRCKAIQKHPRVECPMDQRNSDEFWWDAILVPCAHFSVQRQAENGRSGSKACPNNDPSISHSVLLYLIHHGKAPVELGIEEHDSKDDFKKS